LRKLRSLRQHPTTDGHRRQTAPAGRDKEAVSKFRVVVRYNAGDAFLRTGRARGN